MSILFWHEAVTAASAADAPATPPPSPAHVLSDAMVHRDLPSGKTALLGTLADLGAEVSRGQSVGNAIQAILVRDHVPAPMQPSVRMSLLANWHTASEFGLVTPENLERMRSGSPPLVTIGAFRGQQVLIAPADLETATYITSFRVIPGPLLQTLAPPPTESSYPSTPIQIPGQPPNWRPGTPPASVTLSPNDDSHEIFDVEFLEINRGESVKFAKYDADSEEVFINAADEKTGVVYATVDPARMKVESSTNGYRRIPNTKTYTAPWNFVPVPGRTEKGIYLTSRGTVSLYFLGTTDNVTKNRYRVCVVIGNTPVTLQPDQPPIGTH